MMHDVKPSMNGRAVWELLVHVAGIVLPASGDSKARICHHNACFVAFKNMYRHSIGQCWIAFLTSPSGIYCSKRGCRGHSHGLVDAAGEACEMCNDRNTEF